MRGMIIIVIVLMLGIVISATAQNETLLSLEADSTLLQTGQIYEVRVRAQNVPRLWLVQLEIRYDPQHLYIMGTRSGAPLQTGDWIGPEQSLVVNNRASDGLIEYTVSRLAPADNASGDGVIAHFRIYPLRAGETQLTFNRGEIIAVAFEDTASGRIVREQVAIPFVPQLLSLTVSGETVAPPPEATATPQASITPPFDFELDATPQALNFTAVPTLVNVTAVPQVDSAILPSQAPSPLIFLALALMAIGSGGFILLLWVRRRSRS